MMTDADGLFAARFAATRNSADSGDWADVLHRRAKRRRQKGMRLITSFAVAAAVIAPTTLAFSSSIHDLFFGTPAPPIITRQFVEQNRMTALMRSWERAHGHPRPGMLPVRVDPAKAHGVIAVKTHDGLLLLWAAPAANGRQCWFVDFARDELSHKQASGSGSCETAAPPPSKISWGYGWSAEHPTLKVLSGRVYVRADSLVVHPRAGTVKRIPIVGGYFLAAFPKSARTPTELVASDNGHVVATYKRH